jgi:hypothetical protein
MTIVRTSAVGGMVTTPFCSTTWRIFTHFLRSEFVESRLVFVLLTPKQAQFTMRLYIEQ